MKTEKYYHAIEDLGLNLEYCGIEHCVPNFAVHTHRREVFLIHCVLDGKGTFIYQDKTYSISAGNLFAIFPQEFCSYYTSPDNPLSFCWFGFSGRNAPRMLERVGLSSAHPVCWASSTEEILHLAEKCISYHSTATPSEIQIQSLLYRLFYQIETLTADRNTPKQRGSIVQEHVEQAKRYIRFNYMKSLSISQVASYLGLERTYFSKIFRQFEGITPQDYLLAYRIETACHMLIDSEYSIKEIGYLVGLHDAYYFSQAFKKILGLAPLHYRRQNIRPSGDE